MLVPEKDRHYAAVPGGVRPAMLAAMLPFDVRYSSTCVVLREKVAPGKGGRERGRADTRCCGRVESVRGGYIAACTLARYDSHGQHSPMPRDETQKGNSVGTVAAVKACIRLPRSFGSTDLPDCPAIRRRNRPAANWRNQLMIACRSESWAWVRFRRE